MEIFSRNISYIDLHHIGILKKNFRDLRQETKTACSIPFVPIELEPVTLSRAVCYMICNAAQSAIFGNDDSLEELFSVLFKQYIYELQLYIVLHLKSFR